jgi:hypothetical protein
VDAWLPSFAVTNTGIVHVACGSGFFANLDCFHERPDPQAMVVRWSAKQSRI